MTSQAPTSTATTSVERSETSLVPRGSPERNGRRGSCDTSFVSLLSDSGLPIEEIADLCGGSGIAVTETVYRHQLRPVLMNGATAMDRIFDDDWG
jgi:hypothetical protein